MARAKLNCCIANFAFADEMPDISAYTAGAKVLEKQTLNVDWGADSPVKRIECTLYSTQNLDLFKNHLKQKNTAMSQSFDSVFDYEVDKSTLLFEFDVYKDGKYLWYSFHLKDPKIKAFKKGQMYMKEVTLKTTKPWKDEVKARANLDPAFFTATVNVFEAYKADKPLNSTEKDNYRRSANAEMKRIAIKDKLGENYSGDVIWVYFDGAFTQWVFKQLGW